MGSCRGNNHSKALTEILARHGVNHVVLSPGSRNAPVIEAISCSMISTTVVIDERSAAFVALGIAKTSSKPVAIVCTSGTAVLNYAPAIAEAKACHVQLIVITADRPHEIIGRNEPQTLVQPGAYASILCDTYRVDDRMDSRWFELTVNDAVNYAITNRLPVHINYEISDPTVGQGDDCIGDKGQGTTDNLRIIKAVSSPVTLSRQQFKDLAEHIASPRRILIVAGGYSPSQRLNKAISRLSSWGNIVTLADAISNLHGNGIYTTVDTIISGLTPESANRLRPDVVITFGLPLIATSLKNLITDWNTQHWHVSTDTRTCDTFGSLHYTIVCDPEEFFTRLVASSRRAVETSGYSLLWQQKASTSIESTRNFIEASSWCDMKAVNTVLDLTPSAVNLFFSNGMSVRYGQMLPRAFHRVDCNRGVSGIDGCTSTAIGGSIVYKGTTMLVTGDMSALYDLNSLTLGCISPRFKMVVIRNGGGGIFNFIRGTRDFDGVDRYLRVDSHYNFDGLARDYGFEVYHAYDQSTTREAMIEMINDISKPGILIIDTDPHHSSEIMQQFYKRNIK